MHRAYEWISPHLRYMSLRFAPGRLPMTDVAAERRSAALSRGAVLVLIAAGLALAGLLLRYLAFRHALPDRDPAEFVETLCRWDCEWYVRLADDGYDGFPTPKLINAGNWAFFPLYPMVIGAFAGLTGLPTIHVATGISILTSMAAAVAAYPLLGRDLRAFTLFAAFLLCGPFSVYFTTFFTEVLFACLTVAVFAALQERRFLLAGVLAGCLSATRIVGVFIVFAIVWEVWAQHRERGGTWRDFIPATLARPELVLTFALAPLGLFAYMAFLHFHIGDALAFQHVQRAWGRPFGLPPVFIWNALTSFPREGWSTASQLLGLAAVTGYALVIGLGLTRRYDMAIYAGIALTLPLFAGMASMTRFVAGMAPFPLLVADLAGRRAWSFVLGMAVLVAGGWWTTLAWLDWSIALV
jgi:hypothetical protein